MQLVERGNLHYGYQSGFKSTKIDTTVNNNSLYMEIRLDTLCIYTIHIIISE
ncbi:MAG: hypothetical protein ACFFC3_13340 [Candidatus Odinarchaeota archaeon]